jgi:hypothetical protein
MNQLLVSVLAVVVLMMMILQGFLNFARGSASVFAEISMSEQKSLISDLANFIADRSHDFHMHVVPSFYNKLIEARRA